MDRWAVLVYNKERFKCDECHGVFQTGEKCYHVKGTKVRGSLNYDSDSKTIEQYCYRCGDFIRGFYPIDDKTKANPRMPRNLIMMSDDEFMSHILMKELKKRMKR